MDTHALSLGHLLLFDALYQLRSVSEAARVLGVPQSTLSRWLSQLRDHFDDPLFVRTRAGMEPTATASRVAKPIADIVLIHRTSLSRSASFEPTTSTRRFRIAASDFGHLLFIPQIYAAMTSEALHVKVDAVTLGRRPLINELESGAVDLAIGGFPALGAGVREQTLFRDDYVCLLRGDHPHASGLDLATFKACTHVIVRARELGHVHEQVEARLVEVVPPEQIRVTCESFVVSALLAQETDVVLTVPARLGEWFEARTRLVAVPVPLTLPTIEVKQYWHERFDVDPALVWLRRFIASRYHQHTPSDS